MRDRGAVFVHHLVPTQALQLDGRRQARFDAGAFALEVVDQALRAGLVAGCLRFVIEHQFNELALRQKRRKVGQRDDEIALVHRAQALEESAALFVHGGRHRIGEMRQARFGVVGCRPAHGIDVEHPAVTQARERLIDAERHHFPLFIGAACVVVALVEPRGDERPVLTHDHAVIDHGGVVE
ncbi:hypothetical protein L963_1733 [Leuconostoc mesenteroides subsp. cremoris T26]|nr:hypothetical protein L963_1733 [Leuconostoc mesenteroides subsp. cremoris T26]